MQRIALPMQAMRATGRLLLFILSLNLFGTKVTAQVNDTTNHAGCGTTPDFLASLGVDTTGGSGGYGLTAPDVFPITAKDTCGRFIVYYEDMIVGSGGFADASFGAARRANLCAC